MTRIATRLEEAGLVQRRPDPTDRRVARLALRDLACCLPPTPCESLILTTLPGPAPQDLEVLSQAAEIMRRLAGEAPSTPRPCSGRCAGGTSACSCPASCYISGTWMQNVALAWLVLGIPAAPSMSAR